MSYDAKYNVNIYSIGLPKKKKIQNGSCNSRTQHQQLLIFGR